MKRGGMEHRQSNALHPLMEAMEQAVADEDLLLRIFTAMGPYAFDGTPRDAKEWGECLRALRDRFGFDDSE